eukprot:1173872-Prorocentrum_minimum.AAC.1
MQLGEYGAAKHEFCLPIEAPCIPFVGGASQGRGFHVVGTRHFPFRSAMAPPPPPVQTPSLTQSRTGSRAQGCAS